MPDGEARIKPTFDYCECLFQTLLYSALAECAAAPGHSIPADQLAHLQRPSLGNYLGLLAATVKDAATLPATGALREALRALLPTADPLHQSAEAIAATLKYPLGGRNLSLKMLFDLLVKLRNAHLKERTVTQTALIALIAELDALDCLGELRRRLTPLEDFPLGFVSALTGADTAQMWMLRGTVPIGTDRQDLPVGSDIAPGQVWLCQGTDAGLRLLAPAAPFFVVAPSGVQDGIWQLHLYQSTASSGTRHRLNYINYLDQERLSLPYAAADDPLARSIVRLSQAADTPPTDPPPRATKSASPLTADTPPAHLRVQVLPPLAGVAVAVHQDDPDGPLLAETHTRTNGLTPPEALPAGPVTIAARHEYAQGDGSVRVTATAGPLTLLAGETHTQVINLPYSLGYAPAWMALMQRLYDTQGWLRRHWRTGLVTAAGLAGLALAGLIGYQHFLAPAPPDMVYVPVLATYRTGNYPETTHDDPVGAILRAVELAARHENLNAEATARSIFNNPPHDYAAPAPFHLDKTEVTVQRYRDYLAQLTASEGQEAGQQARPAHWTEQLDVASPRPGVELRYPVRYLTWSQAERFCRHASGRLPLSEEWEIAARNLEPDDPKSKGTMYSWGNDYIEGASRTSQAGVISHQAPVTVCGTVRNDLGDINRKGVCDLSGNLLEFTGSRASDLQGYIVRSEHFRDSGLLGGFGFVIAGWAGAQAEGEATLGYRCAYDDPLPPQIAPADVARYEAGRYHHLGYPDDPRLRLFERYYRREGRKLEHFVAAPRTYSDVGGFFVMARKVSQREFRAFYDQTTQGKGPWSVAMREPPQVRHTPPDGGQPESPALGVSWYSAQGYCAWRGMRLPTAEEWERIVRGDSAAIFPWGNDDENALGQLRRFRDDAQTPSERLRAGMWKDGPEWTATEGWNKGAKTADTRLLKGLFTPASPEDTDYTVTAALPTAPTERYPLAGFRCVQDVAPQLSERWFGRESLHRLSANPLVPKDQEH